MEPELSAPTRSRWLRLAVSLLISILAIYLTTRDLDFSEVWQVLQQIRLPLVLAALGSVALNLGCKAIRWAIVVRSGRPNIAARATTGPYLIGQMLNALIPGRVGDMSRIWMVGTMGAGRTYTLGTVILEKSTDLVAFGILFLVLVFLTPLPAWIGNSAVTILGIALLIIIGLILVASLQTQLLGLFEQLTRWISSRIRNFLLHRLQAGLSSVGIIQKRTALTLLVCLTGLVWGTAILNNHLVLRAFDLQLSLDASILLLIALQLGISVASVPASIGVFEFICIQSLSLYGVDRELAFGYCILLHTIVYIPVLTAGLAALWARTFRSHRPWLPASGELE